MAWTLRDLTLPFSMRLHRRQRLGNSLPVMCSGFPWWDWDGSTLCPLHGCRLSTFFQKMHISDVSGGVWCTIWCRYTPDHAQSPFERPCRIFKRRSRQRWFRQCFVADRLPIYAHQSTARAVFQLSLSRTKMLPRYSVYSHDSCVRCL